MSDSVWPHRWQPTRLPRPWDSPGKNTGVGCHFLLQCMKVKNESEVTQSCPTSRPRGLQPTRLLHPWDFPGKSTVVGCHCLLLGTPKNWTESSHMAFNFTHLHAVIHILHQCDGFVTIHVHCVSYSLMNIMVCIHH